MHTTPSAVRILPMDHRVEFSEYKRLEDIQDDFFLGEFKQRTDGNYRFYKKGLKAEPGTIVLFQCDGTIIASAILRNRERFEYADEDGYEGSLYFDITSIEVFDPVSRDVLGKIRPEVKRLGRAKWSLDPKGYLEFRRNLKNIRKPNF